MKNLVSRNGETVQIEAMIETLEREPNKREIIEALRGLRQDKVKQALGGTLQAARFDREQALEAFLLEKAQRSGSRHTVQTYRREIERMFSWLDRQGVYVLQMSRQDVIGFKGWLSESYSANTVRTALAACSTFWTWLEAEQYTDRRPWTQISYPKREYKKAIHTDQGSPVPVMNETEYLAITEALERKIEHEGNRVYDERIRQSAKKLRVAVHFMGEYGLRIGDLERMRLEDENRFSYREKGGKIKQKALRPVSETVLLETGRMSREPFKGIGRAAIQTGIWRLTRELAARGVIRHAYSCHDFRHYFAIKLYGETQDVYAVKEALGHATVSVTEVYLAGLGALNRG